LEHQRRAGDVFLDEMSTRLGGAVPAGTPAPFLETLQVARAVQASLPLRASLATDGVIEDEIVMRGRRTRVYHAPTGAVAPGVRTVLVPDPQWVAFDHASDQGPRDIKLLDVRTKQVRTLLGQASNDTLPVFLNGGRSLLFASDRLGPLSLWRLPLANGEAVEEPVVVRRDVGRICPLGMSPSGTFVYAVQNGLVDVIVPVAAGVDITAGNGCSYGPDGRTLAWSVREGSGPKSQHILRVRDADGTIRELLRAMSPEWLMMHDWAPDGRALFIVRQFPMRPGGGPERSELWRVPLDGTAPHYTGVSVPTLRGVSVHPDGRTIAYTAGLPTWEVWAMEGIRYVVQQRLVDPERRRRAAHVDATRVALDRHLVLHAGDLQREIDDQQRAASSSTPSRRTGWNPVALASTTKGPGEARRRDTCPSAWFA
jgi:hypothetical protein